MADKKTKRRTGGQAESRTSGQAERRSWLEKGDLVRGPGFSGTGTVLGIAFLNWGKSGHVYHVKDARGITQAIYASEMKRVRRGTSEPRRPASKSGSDRDPSRDSKKQSLEHAARQWADHRKHYHLSSDYFELDRDARDYLLDLMGQTAWRQSPASKASGRSKLYAFSIALRNAASPNASRMKHLAKRFGASRDPGKAHHHRKAGAPSFAKQKLISKKIRLLVREGYGPKQAAAIAYRTYGASRPRSGRDA